MSTPLVVRDADLREVVELVADTVERADHACLPQVAPVDDGASFTASVVIRGASSALVTIVCSRRLSIHIAALMFGKPDVGDDELRDALGEVVNMVGGNLKALLPHASSAGRLSLPDVQLGETTIPRASPISQMQLSWGNDAMTVKVFPFVEDGETADG